MAEITQEGESGAIPVVDEAATIKAAEQAADAAAGGDNEDREPGGVDPQAVRARKEYRARKRVETELRTERDARIAAEARSKAIEEQATRPAKVEPARKFSVSEVQAAVDAGTIGVIEAADYLAKQRAEEATLHAVQVERTRYESDTRHNTAVSQLQEYATLVPWINDKSDARFSQLTAEYDKLTNPNGLYRLPQSPATDLLVLHQALGSLEQLKKKGGIVPKRDTHVEAGAGGGGGVGGVAGAADLSKAPKHFVDFWNRSGTNQKDREAEFKIYQRREAARKFA